VLYLIDGKGHFYTVDDFLCSSLMKDLHGGTTRIDGSAGFIPALKVHCNGKGDCSCS
jgi:hypothetical protein